MIRAPLSEAQTEAQTETETAQYGLEIIFKLPSFYTTSIQESYKNSLYLNFPFYENYIRQAYLLTIRFNENLVTTV